MVLIDKDALLGFEKFDAQIEEHIADDILSIIKTAPPIDPVHVAGGCYCRECRYYNLPRQMCRNPNGLVGSNNIVKIDDFCSYGCMVVRPEDFCSSGKLMDEMKE